MDTHSLSMNKTQSSYEEKWEDFDEETSSTQFSIHSAIQPTGDSEMTDVNFETNHYSEVLESQSILKKTKGSPVRVAFSAEKFYLLNNK
jgi:hypothetical protein